MSKKRITRNENQLLIQAANGKIVRFKNVDDPPHQIGFVTYEVESTLEELGLVVVNSRLHEACSKTVVSLKTGETFLLNEELRWAMPGDPFVVEFGGINSFCDSQTRLGIKRAPSL